MMGLASPIFFLVGNSLVQNFFSCLFRQPKIFFSWVFHGSNSCFSWAFCGSIRFSRGSLVDPKCFIFFRGYFPYTKIVVQLLLLFSCKSDKKQKQRNAYQKAHSTSTLFQQLPINSAYTRKILRLLDYFAITQL